MNNQTRDEGDIVARLHEFSCAYSTKNPARVLASFSRGSDVMNVVVPGSAPPVVGRDALQQRLVEEFNLNIDLKLQPRWLNINVSGDVAWVVASSEALLPGLQITTSSRFTAILIRENDGWFISHLHFSFPHHLAIGATSIGAAPSADI